MTDEEMAEEYAGNECRNCTYRCDKPNMFKRLSNKKECHAYFRSYEAFLAGLKAGRPQWHDLRKDPNDLPDEGTYLVVWRNDYGYKELFMMNYEEDDEEELHWVDGDYENQDEHIIAWCEIPKFEE